MHSAGIGVAQIPIVAAVACARAADVQPLAPLAIRAGCERDWLAPLSLDVLAPSDRLSTLLTGVGVTTCGDLARPHP